MNKLSIIVTSVVITMSLIEIAHANNHSSLLNDWTGFYAGADAGFVTNDIQLKSQQLGFTNPSETCNTSENFSTFSPGIQLGYLYQFSNSFVTGIEANVAVNTHQQNTLSCICTFNSEVSDSFLFKNNMQSSVKARLGRGITWNNYHFLPYFTVGLSAANIGLTYQNEGGDYYSTNTTQTDWLIGAGIEWALAEHWSLRAEYSYVNYGNTLNLKLPTIYGLDDPNGNAHINLSSNNVVVSINYWI